MLKKIKLDCPNRYIFKKFYQQDSLGFMILPLNQQMIM